MSVSTVSHRHPWTYANLIWMHNGCIADFHKIKRRLQNDLSDEMFSVPQGNTDSEWSFALFLDQLAHVRRRPPFMLSEE